MFALFYVVLRPSSAPSPMPSPKGPGHVHQQCDQGGGLPADAHAHAPLLAFSIVGLGAAYSPAKYGILTELLPPSQLVKANGWIEGLTIASIILGVVLGGQMVGPVVSGWLLAFDLPLIDTGLNTPAEAAIACLVGGLCAGGLVQHPHPADWRRRRAMPRNPLELLPDFWTCNSRLWRDRPGPDLARHHHAVLGRERQPALHRAGLGRRRARATAPRRPPAWSAWWRSAPRSARGHRCACGSTRPPASCRWASAWACWSILMNVIDNVWLARPS